MKKDESAAPVSGSTGLEFGLFEPGDKARETHQSLPMTLSERCQLLLPESGALEVEWQRQFLS